MVIATSTVRCRNILLQFGYEFMMHNRRIYLEVLIDIIQFIIGGFDLSKVYQHNIVQCIVSVACNIYYTL